MGKKLSLKGNISSRYFERDGDKLYEWNADGDVIVYALNEDGSFSQAETYLSLVPRSNYREFFFYNDDKFICVNTGNLVSMHRIVDGRLVTVKTPSGAETFGSSFNMIKFIPAKGFFYSIAPTTGDLRTWFANNDATWGSSNGTTVTKGFFMIRLYCLIINTLYVLTRMAIYGVSQSQLPERLEARIKLVRGGGVNL